MTERSKNNVIKQVYFNLTSPGAFAGVDKVFSEANRINSKITRNDVEKYLQTQDTYTIYKPKRTHFKRLATIPSGLHSDWQSDLAIFDNLYKNNDGFKYLLVAVDVLSRKIFVAPVRSKGTRDMITAFDLLFKKANIRPHKLYSDRGLEFQSKSMLEYFGKKGIQKFPVYSDDIHAGVVERANRTIKERLYRYFHQNKTHRWVDIIDRIVNAINNSPNRTTGIAPNEFTYENAEENRKRIYGDNPYEEEEGAKPKYKVGDIVRISINKGKFAKGYRANYTTEKFRVIEVHKTNPPYYKIEDLNHEEILGKFYQPEVSKVGGQIGEGWLKPQLWQKL